MEAEKFGENLLYVCAIVGVLIALIVIKNLKIVSQTQFYLLFITLIILGISVFEWKTKFFRKLIFSQRDLKEASSSKIITTPDKAKIAVKKNLAKKYNLPYTIINGKFSCPNIFETEGTSQIPYYPSNSAQFRCEFTITGQGVRTIDIPLWLTENEIENGVFIELKGTIAENTILRMDYPLRYPVSPTTTPFEEKIRAVKSLTESPEEIVPELLRAELARPQAPSEILPRTTYEARYGSRKYTKTERPLPEQVEEY